MSIGARKRPEDLTSTEFEQLKAAHARLREAVAAADEFRGKELKPGEDPKPKQLKDMAHAYARIDDAERDLWALRESLMGWSRPASAISARESIDWVLEDLEGEEGS